MPKRNYGFEKRQKELAKMQKRQLKADRRAERAQAPQDEQTMDPPPAPAPEPEE